NGQKYHFISEAYETQVGQTSANWRFYADGRQIFGRIWPSGLEEAAPIQAVPCHFFRERPARDIEPVHHRIDPAPGFYEATLDQGAFEGFDLRRERLRRAVRGLLLTQQRLAQPERIALGDVAQFPHVARPVVRHQHVHRRLRDRAQFTRVRGGSRRGEI